MDKDRSMGHSRMTLQLVDYETKRKCPESLPIQVGLEASMQCITIYRNSLIFFPFQAGSL